MERVYLCPVACNPHRKVSEVNHRRVDLCHFKFNLRNQVKGGENFFGHAFGNMLHRFGSYGQFLLYQLGACNIVDRVFKSVGGAGLAQVAPQYDINPKKPLRPLLLRQTTMFTISLNSSKPDFIHWKASKFHFQCGRYILPCLRVRIWQTATAPCPAPLEQASNWALPDQTQALRPPDKL